jgi:hypothetical protein
VHLAAPHAAGPARGGGRLPTSTSTSNSTSNPTSHHTSLCPQVVDLALSVFYFWVRAVCDSAVRGTLQRLCARSLKVI